MIALEISTAAVLLLWLYVFIVVRWQRGFVLLMAYLPFAGAVTLALHSWTPSLLFKDVFFVVPIYIALLGEIVVHKHLLAGFPRSITFLMFCLAALTLIQATNPGVANAMMALIGLKVWLFYLPLSFVAYAYVDCDTHFFRLCRLLVILAFMPSAVAIVQTVMVRTLGYHAAMEVSYGDMASQATQMFSASRFGTVLFGRTPSTFTFATQFFGFSLSMLVPAYILWRTEPSQRWRRIGGCAFITATLATFISGERASFLFTPMTIALMCLFDRGLPGFVAGIGGGIFIAWTVVTGAFGIALWQMYGLVGSLFTHYASDIAYGGLLQAVKLAPLGMGTGTNTGAARYAMGDSSSFIGIENYYAKAVYELGLPGLLIVVSLLMAIAISGFKVRAGMKAPILHCWSSTLVAFFVIIVLNSFKGWLVDLDPVNVYYWIFCGMLLKLPVLQMRALEGSPEDAGAAPFGLWDKLCGE
jgi:hypothetical protein